MSEPRAEYIAAEAIRAEQAQVEGIADYLLGVMAEMPGIHEDMWRYALQQVYERVGEIGTNNPV